MTARLLRQYNISVAHKPMYKLRSYFTKHKDKTDTTQARNAIYMIPCKNCPQQYIGQTSKKIETRLTEHRNAIKRHDLRSLPAAHTVLTTIVTRLTGHIQNYSDVHAQNMPVNLN